MARIQPVPPPKASWLLRMANRYSRKKVGKLLEPIGVMGHHGWVLGANAAFELAMGRARKLPGRLKTLASMKAATLTGCPF